MDVENMQISRRSEIRTELQSTRCLAFPVFKIFLSSVLVHVIQLGALLLLTWLDTFQLDLYKYQYQYCDIFYCILTFSVMLYVCKQLFFPPDAESELSTRPWQRKDAVLLMKLKTQKTKRLKTVTMGVGV